MIHENRDCIWRLSCKPAISKSYFLAAILSLSNCFPAGAQNDRYGDHELTYRSAFSSDASKIVTIDGKLLHVVDLHSGKEIMHIKGHEFQIYAAAFSPDGKRILAGDGNSFRLWDVETGKQVIRFETRNGNLSCLAFTPDARFTISGHSFGSGVLFDPPLNQFLWNLATGEVVSDHELCRFAGQEDVNCIAISPDGTQVICGRKDGTAHLLEIETGKTIQRMDPKAGSIHSIAFSPDGKQVLIGAEKGKICLWGISEKGEELRLVGHEDAVYCVSFSASGRLALSGSSDGAKLWNLRTGKELANFKALGREVNSLIFAPDNKSAYVADGMSGKWKQWKLPE